MSLFTPDLYRNFGIGFLAGALVVGFTSGGDILNALSSIV